MSGVTFLGGEAPPAPTRMIRFVQLVVDTAEDVYGMPMQVVPMIGGSGPNHAFTEYLRVPIVTAGIGHPGSQAHAPNENMRLDLYLKGAQHIARILERIKWFFVVDAADAGSCQHPRRAAQPQVQAVWEQLLQPL
jgi:acetylornithine deacetylase/succinyl-diaminopimelate desuccinylase-like protein